MKNNLFVATTAVVLIFSLIPEKDVAVTTNSVNEHQIRLMENFRVNYRRKKEQSQTYILLTKVKTFFSRQDKTYMTTGRNLGRAGK